VKSVLVRISVSSAHPVVRIVQPPRALPIGGRQPSGTDNGQKHITLLRPAQNPGNKILAHPNRLTGEENIVGAEL
jgi:hypothetical protein